MTDHHDPCHQFKQKKTEKHTASTKLKNGLATTVVFISVLLATIIFDRDMMI
jgi:hypothetical protein